MTSTHNPADQLKRMIAEDRISEDSLQAITGFESEKLRAFLDEADSVSPASMVNEQALSMQEALKVSILAAQLADGMSIGSDERLQAIFESLTVDCRLSLSNLARLLDVNADDLEHILQDPRLVPIETKYELALQGSYLINVVSRAREN